MRSELALVPRRLDALASGLPLLSLSSSSPYPGTPSLHHIEHCLRLFDAYLLGSQSEREVEKTEFQHYRKDGFSNDLISLIAYADLIGQDHGYRELLAVGMFLEVKKRHSEQD